MDVRRFQECDSDNMEGATKVAPSILFYVGSFISLVKDIGYEVKNADSAN
jgi:hypothetical protein